MSFLRPKGRKATEARRTTAELPGSAVSPLVSLLVAAAQSDVKPSPAPLDDSQVKAEIEAEIIGDGSMVRLSQGRPTYSRRERRRMCRGESMQ